MDSYLAKHGFEVIRRKPWQSHPGGLIFELAQCPFDATHGGGSAAFTLENGKPGFDASMTGVAEKPSKMFSPISTGLNGRRRSRERIGTGENRPKAAQSQLLVECAADGRTIPHARRRVLCVPARRRPSRDLAAQE